MSYDSKCYELAEHFLPSQASKRLKDELAQHIQSAVEDFCDEEIERLEADVISRAVGKT